MAQSRYRGIQLGLWTLVLFGLFLGERLLWRLDGSSALIIIGTAGLLAYAIFSAVAATGTIHDLERSDNARTMERDIFRMIHEFRFRPEDITEEEVEGWLRGERWRTHEMRRLREQVRCPWPECWGARRETCRTCRGTGFDMSKLVESLRAQRSRRSDND